MPRLHSYVIDHDLGFAPNPFYGFCTLAACKPRIRKHAAEGDYIVGTGSSPNNGLGKVVYWMKVDEILSFDQYWNDKRFLRKRPILRGSNMQRYGDNIYRTDESGKFLQIDSFHSEAHGVISAENLEVDTGYSQEVLVGSQFAYWGGTGPLLPPALEKVAHSTQGHKNNKIPAALISDFIAWATALPDRGFCGRPTNWP